MRPDLDGIRVERGDYVERQLAERTNHGELVGDIVTHWLRLVERRKTVVFATGVTHSVHIRDEFRRAGIMAEHVDGSTSVVERETILAGLSRGEVDVVVNCMVLTEGIETAVACTELFGVPSRAATSTGGMESFEPPAAIKRVPIFGDDDSNFAGQKAAFILAHRLDRDIAVEVSVLAKPGADWLDVLNKGAGH